MQRLKILIVEAISSGYTKHGDASILSEGLAMLVSITNDMLKAGYDVSIVLEKKLMNSTLRLKASRIFKVGTLKDSSLKAFAKNHDFVYIIAPESENLLSKMVESLDSFHINSKPKTIRLMSDKARMLSELSKRGFRVPETLKSPFEDSSIEDLGFPLIIKPCFGAGCEGLKIVKDTGEFHKVFKSLNKVYGSLIAQKLIKGIPASVSVMTDGSRVKPLALNKQFIKFDNPSYFGGYTPLNHALKQKAFDMIKKLVENFKGLKGYVGIDIVFSKNEVYIIEVNPRLTVSYVGLSKVSKINLARLMVDSCLKSLPDFNPSFDGSCYFRKTIFKKCFTKKFMSFIKGFDEILVPPIPLNDSNEGYGFITTISKSFFEARKLYLRLIDKITKETGCQVV
ncbi:MAG: ATP-grasp domain-containing protein [Candidatus Bathyarchaeia archaeon]